jgi:hypothetical protein
VTQPRSRHPFHRAFAIRNLRGRPQIKELLFPPWYAMLLRFRSVDAQREGLSH